MKPQTLRIPRQFGTVWYSLTPGENMFGRHTPFTKHTQQCLQSVIFTIRLFRSTSSTGIQMCTYVYTCTNVHVHTLNKLHWPNTHVHAHTRTRTCTHTHARTHARTPTLFMQMDTGTNFSSHMPHPFVQHTRTGNYC